MNTQKPGEEPARGAPDLRPWQIFVLRLLAGIVGATLAYFGAWNGDNLMMMAGLAVCAAAAGIKGPRPPSTHLPMPPDQES